MKKELPKAIYFSEEKFTEGERKWAMSLNEFAKTKNNIFLNNLEKNLEDIILQYRSKYEDNDEMIKPKLTEKKMLDCLKNINLLTEKGRGEFTKETIIKGYNEILKNKLDNPNITQEFYRTIMTTYRKFYKLSLFRDLT